MFKYILAVVGFVVFSGCAPVYVVKNQYIPPKAENTKCLNSCLQSKKECKNECVNKYQSCMDDAFEKAKKVYAKLNNNYERKYKRYLLKMEDYDYRIFDWHNDYDESYRDWQYFRKECKVNPSNKYACDREDDLMYVIKKLRRDKPKKPRIPRKESFEKILKAEQSKCVKNCGCNDLYDSCFVSCGGEIIPHKICVKNCK